MSKKNTFKCANKEAKCKLFEIMIQIRLRNSTDMLINNWFSEFLASVIWYTHTMSKIPSGCYFGTVVLLCCAVEEEETMLLPGAEDDYRASQWPKPRLPPVPHIQAISWDQRHVKSPFSRRPSFNV